MVLLGKGPWSVPDPPPTDKILQDENETKSSHSDHHSHVILVTKHQIMVSGKLDQLCTL